MSERNERNKYRGKAPEGFISLTHVAREFRTSVPTLIKVIRNLEMESGRPLETKGRFIDLSEMPRLANGIDAYPFPRPIHITNNGDTPKSK